jgi:hypothetical protein
MLEEVLGQIDDRRRQARRHPLPVAAGVEVLGQLGLDPDVDRKSR